MAKIVGLELAVQWVNGERNLPDAPDKSWDGYVREGNALNWSSSPAVRFDSTPRDEKGGDPGHCDQFPLWSLEWEGKGKLLVQGTAKGEDPAVVGDEDAVPFHVVPKAYRDSHGFCCRIDVHGEAEDGSRGCLIVTVEVAGVSESMQVYFD
jgi:hypothetical protein